MNDADIQRLVEIEKQLRELGDELAGFASDRSLREWHRAGFKFAGQETQSARELVAEIRESAEMEKL